MARNVNPVFDVPSLNHDFFYRTSLPYIKNKKVLDIGCWSGMYESMIFKDVKQVTGIDPTTKAINMAKKRVPKAKFYVGRAEKLDFPKNSFDTVTFFEVIEHIPDNTEKDAIKEVNKVLRNGGTLILSTPNNNLISIILDPAFFLIHHRHYSQKYLVSLLKSNGFKIIKKSKYGGIFFLINANLELIFKHLFKIRFVPPEFLKKLIINEYENGFAENILIAKKI